MELKTDRAIVITEKNASSHTSKVDDNYIFEIQSSKIISIGDNYHTMTELYEHRNNLYIALCKFLDRLTPLESKYRVIKSKQHFDGSMFDGSFVIMVLIQQLKGDDKQISYHLPIRLWDDCPFLELPTAPEWDGHSSQDVLDILLSL